MSRLPSPFSGSIGRAVRATLCACALIAAAALAACGREAPPAQGAGGSTPGKPAAPVPARTVAATPQQVPIVLDGVGRTEGSRQVEVRARVSGIVERRLYAEGERIREGAPMFQLERAPFEIALAQVRAQAVEAAARVTQAQRDVDRYAPLVEQGYVSRQAWDNARSTLELARAQAEAARAGVRQAELNLSYSLVTAPTSGIAGRFRQSEGALVNAGTDSALLTTINRIDPIWVRFSLAQSDVERLPSGRLAEVDGAEAHLVHQNGQRYPLAGRINFTAAEIDPQLATQELRATFPNPKGELLPGEFARVEFVAGRLEGVYLVPQAAVLETEKGPFLYVLGADGTATLRPVQAGRWSGADWVIRAGLKPGERVIVDNLLKLRPGVPVQALGPEGEPLAPQAAAPPGATATR